MGDGKPGDQPSRDRPGLPLAGQLTRTAGPRDRYAGQADDAVVLAAGRRDATESWVYARKLAPPVSWCGAAPRPGR